MPKILPVAVAIMFTCTQLQQRQRCFLMCLHWSWLCRTILTFLLSRILCIFQSNPKIFRCVVRLAVSKVSTANAQLGRVLQGHKPGAETQKYVFSCCTMILEYKEIRTPQTILNESPRDNAACFPPPTHQNNMDCETSGDMTQGCAMLRDESHAVVMLERTLLGQMQFNCDIPWWKLFVRTLLDRRDDYVVPGCENNLLL